MMITSKDRRIVYVCEDHAGTAYRFCLLPASEYAGCGMLIVMLSPLNVYGVSEYSGLSRITMESVYKSGFADRMGCMVLQQRFKLPSEGLARRLQSAILDNWDAVVLEAYTE